MGTRRKRERQENLWVVRDEIAVAPSHAFYERLNEVLERHNFDYNVEHLCRRYYKGPLGRPSVAPGTYSARCCWASSKGSILSAASPGA